METTNSRSTDCHRYTWTYFIATHRRTFMSVPSDHKIAHRKTSTFKGQLGCPHCQYSFPLTWRQYWATPWGNYRCPQCHKKSHIQANSFWVWPILITVIMVSGITSFALAAYIFKHFLIGTLFFIVGSLGMGLLTDKWLDGHLRILKPSKAKQ